MQGTIMTLTVMIILFARVLTVMLKKQKTKKLRKETERQREASSHTFKRLDHITVSDFAAAIKGRPMFSMDAYKDKVISSVSKDKVKENCIYFWENVPENMTHQDILFMEDLDDLALFVVADRKIDLLRTYVVDDVTKAYNQLIQTYRLTEEFFEASAHKDTDIEEW